MAVVKGSEHVQAENGAAAMASRLRTAGVEEDTVDYIERKLHNVIQALIAHVTNSRPENPEQAILLWLLDRCCVPAPIVAWMKDWAEGNFCETGPSGWDLGKDHRDSIARGSARGSDFDGSHRFSVDPEGADEEGDGFSMAPLGNLGILKSDDERTYIAAAPRSCKRGTAYVTPGGTTVDNSERMHHPPPVLDHQRLAYIKDIPCFGGLSPADLNMLVKAFDVEKHLESEEVVRSGDPMAGIHIIVKGEAKVSVAKEIGTLGPGEAFGELALVSGTPITETVEAVSGSLITLKLDPLAFKALNLKKKMLAMARKHKAAGRRADTHFIFDKDMPSDEAPVSPSTDEERELISEAIRKNQNINDVMTLCDDQILDMASTAVKKRFGKGQVVFNEGDAGDSFYIVEDGTFELLGGGEKLNLVMSCNKLRSGDSFGELALLYDATRMMTVSTVKSGHLWVITRAAMKATMKTRARKQKEDNAKLIDKVPLFDNMSQVDKDSLYDAFDEMYYIKGESVVTQGDAGDSFYLISEGECDVIVDDAVQTSMGVGSFFGEAALLNEEPRAATVTVTSETCRLLVLDKVSFDLLLSPLEEEFNKKAKAISKLAKMGKHKDDNGRPKVRQSALKKPKARTTTQFQSDFDDTYIKREELTRVGVLGTGAFGFVTLEKDDSTGKLYALKAMSKGHICQERLKDAVKNEVGCMSVLDSDFIVKLCCTYRDATTVSLLLEPCFGGELFDAYNDLTLYGSEKHAIFYAGCITLALEHMHGNKIIFRDLKLENCLLTATGWMKLTDMGLAKVVIGKTYTVCGTTDYFAPETLRQTGHNRAVDWWALGVMIFIMMTGRSPFDAPEAMQIYKKIIKGFAKVVFPEELPDQCVSVIVALCQKQPEERLTMGKLGVQNLKDHPWYRGFDWKLLRSQKMTPPYSPELDENEICEKIKAKPPQEMPEFEYKDDGTDWDACFAGGADSDINYFEGSLTRQTQVIREDDEC